MMNALSANLEIVRTLLIALLLGLLVGYERTYHGRAAGMRTYGIVCMSSAALTALVAYPSLWYGGTRLALTSVDPTRVIQGVITGIGFLGSGIIIKDGLNTRGLTTAASVWSASVIGILIGIGFYSAGALLAALSTFCMMYIHQLEERLPSRVGIAVVVNFKRGPTPTEQALRAAVLNRGYVVVDGSLSINANDGAAEWHFVASALDKRKIASMPDLALALSEDLTVASFHLAHFRN